MFTTGKQMRIQSHRMGPQRHQIMPEIYREKKETHAQNAYDDDDDEQHIVRLFTAIIAYLRNWTERPFVIGSFRFRFSDDFYLYDYCYDYAFYVCSFAL